MKLMARFLQNLFSKIYICAPGGYKKHEKKPSHEKNNIMVLCPVEKWLCCQQHRQLPAIMLLQPYEQKIVVCFVH